MATRAWGLATPRQESGRLGSDSVTVGAGVRQREYRAGDLVLFTANDHRLGLLNGSRAVIIAVQAHSS